MSKPQTMRWSEKDLNAFIVKRQQLMVIAGYPLPEGFLGKNTDSESTPRRADQEMLKFLDQGVEAVYDLWVGDAFAEAMKAIGGDPENEAEIDALQLALRQAPFDFDNPACIDEDTTQETKSSNHFRKADKYDEQGVVSDSIAALSQP